MDAGRELDALIAEKVMGWQWYTVVGVNVLLPPGHYYCNKPSLALEGKHGDEDDIESARFYDSSRGGRQMPVAAHYSTNLDDAWRVVEWAKTTGNITIKVLPYVVWAEISIIDPDVVKSKNDIDPRTDFRHAVISATTAPLAICLAALKALT